MENFKQGINNRFKPKLPFPHQNSDMGRGRFILEEISNLESQISQIKTQIEIIRNHNQKPKEKSFLDNSEIGDIIVKWNTHNFNPNDNIRKKWEDSYDQINKNNGNIYPSFGELLGNIQTIYSKLTRNERNSSHHICQRLKQEYYNNSNYSENYPQTTNIENLQTELQNLETKLAELQKIKQYKIDENNERYKQNNGVGGGDKKIRVTERWL